MDPVITPIVTGIAAGAAAGLKDDAAQAVRDAYAAIKSFLTRKYPTIDLIPIETKPDSQAKRASLAEDLADTGADRDPELLALVKALESVVPALAVRQVIQKQSIGSGDHSPITASQVAGDQHSSLK